MFLHNLGDYLDIRHVPCAISIPKRGKNIPSTPHTLGIQFRQPLAASRAAAPCPPPQLFWERKHEKSETMCQFYTIIAPLVLIFTFLLYSNPYYNEFQMWNTTHTTHTKLGHPCIAASHMSHAAVFCREKSFWTSFTHN